MKVVVLVVLLVACGNSERQQDPPSAVEVAVKPQPAPRTVCRGDDVVTGDGRKLASCPSGCIDGSCVNTCGVKDVELIYVVDDRGRLLSFDPKKLPGDPFKEIGTLHCDDSTSPFSMAVDRKGIAWVGYQSGEVYRASIHDARCFGQGAPPTGASSRTFGMGFVTDGPGATTEKLYVSGEGHELATLDTSQSPAVWKREGSVQGVGRNPELTGTADGKLYGFFPLYESGSYVQELDRKGAAVGKRWSLPVGNISAWAIAFWGDVFYVFATSSDGPAVHAIHRTTGKVETVLSHIPYRITGAGVSTCAPLLEKLI